MQRKFTFLMLAAAAIALPTHAQDTRNVTEPKIPATCIKLEAKLVSVDGSLAAEDQSKLDTARIQAAIDGCSAGRAVTLRTHGKFNAFVSGPLVLRSGVTLVVEKGVTLFESVDPTVLQESPGSCGVVNMLAGRGCKPLISVDHAPNAGVMGDGVIDGQGGVKMLGVNMSAWELAEKARAGGGQKVSRLIVADHSDNFTLYNITLKNSQNFHVVYGAGDGLTVWGVKINTPGKGARNADGIDPGNGSKNITVTHSYINAGDDNIAIKGGTGGLTNMTVSHNHFYAGHGMSIGSETYGGVSKVRVYDLSLDGPDNGIRIKSNAARGGLVHDVQYDDICIRNSPNPLYFDTAYSAAGSTEGTRFPSFVDITLHNVRISGGGKITFEGYDAAHRLGLNLDGVTVTDASMYQYSVRHANFKVGPGAMNLKLDGEDTTVTGTAVNSAAGDSCADKFVPFPH